MTPTEMAAIVQAITYKPGWVIDILSDGSRPYVQLTVEGICSQSKQPTIWKSGKTYLSPYMCRQEIVGAVFSAIEKAETHELREWFRYKGASIYNPHLDPDILADVARKGSSFNVRDNAMTMKEG